MKYVIWTRISDEKQKKGTSPETQLEDCIDYIDGKAPHIHFHDVQKAGIPLHRRKTLLEAMDCLEKGDVLLIPNTHRLSRSDESMFMIKAVIKKKKASIEYADGTKPPDESDPSQWIQAKMLEFLAQYEKINFGMRMRKAYRKKRETGEALGFAPYGWANVAGVVVVNHDEQAKLKVMKQLEEKGLKYRQIAREMNAMGLRNRKGNPWQYQSIIKILRRLDKKDDDD